MQIETSKCRGVEVPDVSDFCMSTKQERCRAEFKGSKMIQELEPDLSSEYSDGSFRSLSVTP